MFIALDKNIAAKENKHTAMPISFHAKSNVTVPTPRNKKIMFSEAWAIV